MTTRKYSSRSQQTTLTSAVTSGAVVLPVVSATTLLGGATVSTGQTFTVVIDPDTALEEIVEITVVSGNNLTVTRAVDMAGAAAQDHSSGAVVRHMIIGRDLRESNTHIEASAAYNDGTGTHALHGLGSSDGSVVGTDATQTLTNKTLISPTLTGLFENDASITFEGTTADAFETTLTVVDPTQDNTITLPNTTGTVVIATATQTLTNKTLTSPTISGSPVITGLSSAGMSASSAAPKDYVDSILGSATAASTSAASAATSASSAATSATSAANSASAALTSANSASTSATSAAASAATATTQATAATTSATSAAVSATAAATSATSAAASATAAATSATSAAASATTASASVASIATYASNALASQNAASTSATSAAASATASATSATSAAASATTASNSASTATTQATNAATSASSAATSATAAATSATSAAASATTAANSVATIASYATTASNSASAAATSASSAATSASSAATSASSAATSASDAATTYDNFDDRYLGSKTSAPTLDNDGNTLLVGAIYWNSTAGAMYVWSGSAWVQIATTSVYTAPTLGSTTIASGTTYANVNSLTINSTTIPTSKTLVVTTDKLSVHAATTSAELAGVISDETGSGALVFGTAPTLTGALASADPTADLGLATKQYVDAVTAAINFHAPVKLATTSNLSVTYSNGTSGVGATLTATANGRGSIDGVNITTGDRILVKDQTTTFQNGVYTVTTQGAGGAPYVLTRATDYDTTIEVTNGDITFTTAGTVNTGVTFVNTSTNPVTIGTTAITFSVYTSASLPSQTGQSGKYLTTDGTTPSWGTVSSYTAPTLGSTSIGSGATVTTINGLTKIVSATHASLDASGYEQDIVLMTLMGAWI